MRFSRSPSPALSAPVFAQVLVETQRAFCHLHRSEKRTFDPRVFVDACKCLNLNYNVYQQNDASEFCDKLLEKLEAALEGTPQLGAFKTLLNGSVVNQKIPKDGDFKTTNREEPFVKIELQARDRARRRPPARAAAAARASRRATAGSLSRARLRPLL